MIENNKEILVTKRDETLVGWNLLSRRQWSVEKDIPLMTHAYFLSLVPAWEV
jgi:hypothetical protein